MMGPIMAVEILMQLSSLRSEQEVHAYFWEQDHFPQAPSVHGLINLQVVLFSPFETCS